MGTRCRAHLLLVLALLLAACGRSVLPTPVTNTATPPAERESTAVPSVTLPENSSQASESTQTVPPSTEVPEFETLPTSQVEPALTEGYPAFPGVYWNSKLIVTGNEQSVRIETTEPCTELLNLLLSGEWLLSDQAITPPDMEGLMPSYALLQWEDQLALAELTTPMQLSNQAEPAEGEPAVFTIRCQANLRLVPVLPLEVSGPVNAAGEAAAFTYPACIEYEGTSTALMFYEGPGNLRAQLAFRVPPELGEHSLDVNDVTLVLGQIEPTFMDILEESFAMQTSGENAPDVYPGMAPYTASGGSSGTVTVLSLDPLAGVIELEGMSGPGGSLSFSAGFECSSQP